MNKKMILIGAGGHGRVAADIAKKNGYTEIAFLDDNKMTTQYAEYAVLGKTDIAKKYPDCDFAVSIGAAIIRQKLQEQLEQEHLSVISLIHPDAVIADDVEIGRGTVIMAGATVSNNLSICEDCIIGAGAVVVKTIKEVGTYIRVPAKIMNKSKIFGGYCSTQIIHTFRLSKTAVIFHGEQRRRVA